jgi:DNA-binding transcriptional MocR family regulator
VSKWLGPDLRLAVLVGDDATVARVAGRQSLGTGWVSHLLQRTAAEMWAGPAATRTLRRATDTYGRRRRALRRALEAEGLAVTGRSGLTAWVAVDDELGVTSGLLDAGWAVLPGERFRVSSPPGIRIALSTLREEEAPVFAAALAGCLRQQPVRTT